MKQIHKSYLDALKTLSAVAVGFVAVFFFVSVLFVTFWDTTIVPLFRAPLAPFTAGMGFTLLLSGLVAIFEVLKERP